MSIPGASGRIWHGGVFDGGLSPSLSITQSLNR